MDELAFSGVVSGGIGCHSNLHVPGKGTLAHCDDDWPSTLQPGSLNLCIDGYPPQLVDHGLTLTVAALDSGLFGPAFEIPRDCFGNNKLRPTHSVPRRGDAQVWRASILTNNGEVGDCWVLRRFGSRVGEQLELVAGRRLRDDGLQDGQRVQAILYGRWKEA
jgi:hypothetical protein